MRVVVRYGDGLLPDQSGQCSGDFSYLRYLLVFLQEYGVALIVFPDVFIEHFRSDEDLSSALCSPFSVAILNEDGLGRGKTGCCVEEVVLRKNDVRIAQWVTPIITAQSLRSIALDIQIKEQGASVEVALTKLLHRNGNDFHLLFGYIFGPVGDFLFDLDTHRRHAVVRHVVKCDVLILIAYRRVQTVLPRSHDKECRASPWTGVDADSVPAEVHQVEGVRSIDRVEGSDVDVKAIINIMEEFLQLSSFSAAVVDEHFPGLGAGLPKQRH